VTISSGASMLAPRMDTDTIAQANALMSVREHPTTSVAAVAAITLHLYSS